MKTYYRSLGYTNRSTAIQVAISLGKIEGVYFNVFQRWGKYYFDNHNDPAYISANGET